MKRNDFSQLTGFICLVTILLPGTARLDAQEDTASGVDRAVKDVWQRQVGELGFQSVPVRDVVDALGKHYPEINFVANESAQDILVSVKLRAVSLENILEALTFASDGRVQFKKRDDRLVVVMAREQKRKPPVLQAFNLSRYLGDRKPEEVGEALKDIERVLHNAWAMLREADPDSQDVPQPDLSIHRKTKLLIAVGQEEQLKVISQVVGALDGGSSMPPGFGGGYGGGGGGGYGGGMMGPGMRRTAQPAVTVKRGVIVK